MKFRRNGLIINNRDLVSVDCIDVDASIYFRTSVQFWSIINGGIHLQDAITRNFIICSGCLNYVEMLYSKLINDVVHTSPSSSFMNSTNHTNHRRNASGSEGTIEYSNHSNSELLMNPLNTTPTNTTSSTTVLSALTSTIQATMQPPLSPSLHHHQQQQQQQQLPIKSGWLLKKEMCGMLGDIDISYCIQIN